jgi:YHS domain-containing protein
MKIKYLAIVATVSVMSFAYMNTNTPVFSNHVLAACAGNPCATNPCAANADSAPVIYTESTSGLAIRGTDPVAYFTVGKALAGSSDYEYQWNGATWRFSSQENMELFVANPEQYAPQYGGYCAKGISEGNLVSIDPDAWRIVDGKLYLNYSKDVQKQWLQDIEGNIKLGNENYPSALQGGKVFEN